MSNLATIKNNISTGLGIYPDHITDIIEALTGDKIFADVEAQKSNFPLMNGDNLLGNPLAGNLAKLLNPNYGIGVNIISGDSIEYPATSCNLSNDFTIINQKIIKVK